MTTIDIPESTARKSAEDELVEFLLSKLAIDNKVKFAYFICGCATGDWAETADAKCDDRHHASIQAIKNVLRAFASKGYIVNDRMTTGNYNNVEIIK